MERTIGPVFLWVAMAPIAPRPRGCDGKSLRPLRGMSCLGYRPERCPMTARPPPAPILKTRPRRLRGHIPHGRLKEPSGALMGPYGAAQALMALPDARPLRPPGGGVRGMRGSFGRGKLRRHDRPGRPRDCAPRSFFRSSDLPLVDLDGTGGPLFLRGFRAVTICLRVYHARRARRTRRVPGSL
jgi:hypothetical protein